MIRKSDLVYPAAFDEQRRHAVGDQRAGFDDSSWREDRGPLAVLDSELLRELRRYLAEQLRLQLGEVGEYPRHSAGSVMLRQAIRGEHVRETRVAGREGVSVVGPLLLLRGRILAVLRIECIRHRRLERLVMRGERAILQSARHVDPAF